MVTNEVPVEATNSYDNGCFVARNDLHMGQLIFEHLRRRPDDICQIDAATGEEETNASVLKRTITLAICFIKINLKPGDVLALSGRNHLDLHIPHYAALMTGMPIVGVDPLFKYDEINGIFDLTKPKIAFCQLENYKDYLKAVKALQLETVVITFGEGETSMDEFTKKYMEEVKLSTFAPLQFDTENIYCWLISTGGTTGQLKLAAFKHKPWIGKIYEMITYFKMNDDTIRKPAFNMSPVHWISGFFNTVAVPLMNQIKLQTSAPATVDHVIDVINKYKPSWSVMGPSMLSSILRHAKHCDFTCFDVIRIAGGKVHKDLLLELKKRVRPDALAAEMYGQTETLANVLMPSWWGPIGSCGNPLSKLQIKLVDPESEKEINEANIPGELRVKGDIFTEYYRNTEETAKAFTADGWFKTGDMLYKDESNNYYFVERLKMLIKYRNYQIVPPELEEVIRSLEGVLDVSVTSIPDLNDGELPVACVVRKRGSTVTAQEVKDVVANKLSDPKQLRGGVVFMENLPLTSTGKLARMKLKQMVLNANRE